MLLRLKYDDVKANAAKGEVNGKNVNFFMRVEVDESNIVEAIDRFRGNRYVASLDYVGEEGYLKTIDIEGILVIVAKSVDMIDGGTEYYLSELDPRVRPVLKLPRDFSDMKQLFDLSQKFPNVHFCGGHLIKIDGCNIGAITRNDISKKIPDSRIPLVTEGCACVFQNITIEDADSVEFYEARVSPMERKSRSTSKGKSKSSTSRKKVSAILSTAKTSAFDNF